MGTIISRKRKKDGTLGHTALIRIKRDGIIVHQESETFDRKLAAKAWLKKRESDLAEMGSWPLRAPPDPIFRDVITKYLDEVEAVHPLGKTKRQVLNTVKASFLVHARRQPIERPHPSVTTRVDAMPIRPAEHVRRWRRSVT